MNNSREYNKDKYNRLFYNLITWEKVVIIKTVYFKIYTIRGPSANLYLNFHFTQFKLSSHPKMDSKRFFDSYSLMCSSLWVVLNGSNDNPLIVL